MEKSQIARQLYDIVNKYSDYMICGIERKHEQYEFSRFDNICPPPADKPQVKEQSQDRNSSPATADKMQSVATTPNNSNKTLRMIDTTKEILSCKSCELYKNSKNRIPGRGLVNTKIFVIANPVTFNEEKENFPLSGQEKIFFSKWMEAISIEPANIFITNLLKCNWGNSGIKIQFIEACRKHLDKQIDIVQPEIILTLGQLPLSSLKKAPANMMEEHGKIIYYRNYKVFPIFDPATVLKDQSLKSIVWEDLKILKNEILGV